MSERKRRTWPVVLAVLLALYPLSMPPATLLLARMSSPEDPLFGSRRWAVFRSLYRPVEWAEDFVPGLEPAYEWYVDLWLD